MISYVLTLIMNGRLTKITLLRLIVYFGNFLLKSKLYSLKRLTNILPLFMHSSEESPLSRGEWSNAGCRKVESLSNSSYTMCECDHLTHFAILLSPVPLNFSDGVVVSLEVIGYVGVTISLVAMAIIIATFVIFRYAKPSKFQ